MLSKTLIYPNVTGTAEESEVVKGPFQFLDVLTSWTWEYSSHLIKQTLLSEWKEYGIRSSCKLSFPLSVLKCQALFPKVRQVNEGGNLLLYLGHLWNCLL